MKLLILLLNVNLLAFSLTVKNSFTLNYNGDIINIENNLYSLSIDKYKFNCILLENKSSLCIFDRKNYILNTKMENGIFDSNYLKFQETEYHE